MIYFYLSVLGLGCFFSSRAEYDILSTYSFWPPANISSIIASRSVLLVAPYLSIQHLDTCFSPKEHCNKKLLQFFQTAQTKIDVAVYDITHPDIAQSLIDLQQKLRIRIVVEKKQASGHSSLVPMLINAKLSVKFGRQKGIMHHKFTIIDEKALQTGSFNYTKRASLANQENQIYLTDTMTVKTYQEQFNKLWDENSVPAKLTYHDKRK